MRGGHGWRNSISSSVRRGGGDRTASSSAGCEPEKEIGIMKFLSQTFMIRTDKGPQFIDITERVEDAARQAGVSPGFAVVFSRHPTAATRINDNEPALLGDMEKMSEA